MKKKKRPIMSVRWIKKSVCCVKGCIKTTSIENPSPGWKSIVIGSGTFFERENLLNADVDGLLCPECFKRLYNCFKNSEKPDSIEELDLVP